MNDIRQQWFAEWAMRVQADYDRLREKARTDIQQAGHGGEATWVELLSHWLPSDYEVVGRKYIVPEIGDEMFETDVVVFRPGYPQSLRKQEQVLAGGVAAAFSVKLTLDAAGIEDGSNRAVRLQRGIAPREGSPRREMVGLYPVGLLSHSHAWKGEKSTPLENLESNLLTRTNTHINHPREILDFVCVSDLATSIAFRIPYLPPSAVAHLVGNVPSAAKDGVATTVLAIAEAQAGYGPVASLLAGLYARLAFDDPRLRPLAESFRLTGMLGSPGGAGRQWELKDVFTENVVRQLDRRLFENDEWAGQF